MRRLFCAFLTLVLLCGVFPLTSYAAKPVELSSNYGYGYSFLTQAEKSVYEDISKCIENMDSEVGVDYALGVNVERFSLIVEMVLADNPQYFWFLGSYSYSYAGGFVVGFYPTYSLDGSTVSKTEIVAANAVFEQKLQAILDELSLRGIKDDYDKAVWLHDKVAHIVTYAFGANNQSAYGALVDGYAVCAGYTRLYQTLLLRAGIPAWTVKGTSIDPVSNTPTNHAWTLLWINGNCVYTDLTWNDQGTELYHLYFANGLSEFAETHIPRAPYDELLPECQCVDLGYFDVYAPQYAADSSIDSGKVKELTKCRVNGRSFRHHSVCYSRELTYLLGNCTIRIDIGLKLLTNLAVAKYCTGYFDYFAGLFIKPCSLNVKTDIFIGEIAFNIPRYNLSFSIASIISFYTIEDFYTKFRCRIHRIGKSLYHTVVCDRNCLVSPFCGTL